MTEEKEDGRIIRSKRDLANALIELLQEKNYDDIGIKEITDKARVSKNTFYNNFKDNPSLKEKVQAHREIYILTSNGEEDNSLFLFQGNAPF